MARLYQLGTVLWLLLALSYALDTTTSGTTNDPITAGDETMDNEFQEILDAMDVVYLSLDSIKKMLEGMLEESWIPDDVIALLQNAVSNITDLDQTLQIQMSSLDESKSNVQGKMNTIKGILEALRAILEAICNLLELLIAALNALLGGHLNLVHRLMIELLLDLLKELLDRLQELKDKIDEFLDDFGSTTVPITTPPGPSTPTPSSSTPVTGCCYGGKRYPDGCYEMIMGVLNVCEVDMWEPAR